MSNGDDFLKFKLRETYLPMFFLPKNGYGCAGPLYSYKTMTQQSPPNNKPDQKLKFDEPWGKQRV